MAANTGAPPERSSVAAAIVVMRGEFYERLVARDATQAKFLKGWNNRLDHLSKEIA